MSPWARMRGAALRRARLAAGLTQVQVARRLGVVLTTVQRAEKGQHALAADLVDAWMAACGATLRVQVVPREPRPPAPASPSRQLPLPGYWLARTAPGAR